jgi:hypothetical protein
MNFPKIAEIIPEQEVGCAKVKHFTVNKTYARWAFHSTEATSLGKYAQLFVDGQLYMSDTDMEQRSNNEVVWKANGNVLIAGLGLGMILKPLIEKPEVTHITVIEKYQDVVDMIAPYWKNEKITIICADIFEWKPEKDQKFDTIYFDIWADICTDNLKEIHTLHRRSAKWINRSNPKSWVDSWMKGSLEYQKKKDDKEEKRYNLLRRCLD